MLFCETVLKEEAGHERLVHLSCGMRKVRLPDRREELTLVVVKGFGEEPLMIMTNLAVRRWRIEDVIRFVKQSYRLEDICCLTYHRLQALMVLVTAAAYAGLEASVRHPRLPSLRPGRRDQTVSLQPDPGTDESLEDAKSIAGPTNALRSIIFWGKSSKLFRLNFSLREDILDPMRRRPFSSSSPAGPGKIRPQSGDHLSGAPGRDL
jgi:hypothetical protein